MGAAILFIRTTSAGIHCCVVQMLVAATPDDLGLVEHPWNKLIYRHCSYTILVKILVKIIQSIVEVVT